MGLFKSSPAQQKEMFFKGEYPLARLTMFSYLQHIYAQSITAPEYANEFTYWEDPSYALAVAVIAYIFPDTTTNFSTIDPSTALHAQHVAEQWTYGTMDGDKSFKDFVIKTLQLQCFFEGERWTSGTDEGIRAKAILNHYHAFGVKPVKLRQYSLLTIRWKREVQKMVG